MTTSNKNILYCSFCGKSQHEVRKLIAGPTVFICDECVDLCNNIIEEELSDEDVIVYFDIVQSVVPTKLLVAYDEEKAKVDATKTQIKGLETALADDNKPGSADWGSYICIS